MDGASVSRRAEPIGALAMCSGLAAVPARVLLWVPRRWRWRRMQRGWSVFGDRQDSIV